MKPFTKFVIFCLATPFLVAFAKVHVLLGLALIVTGTLSLIVTPDKK
jgi:hypothetical protein